MRRIGTTNDGNVLCEMTRLEAHMFSRLTLITEGRGDGDMVAYRGTDVFMNDYTGAFGAIVAFVEAKYRVNEIRNLVNEFERVIMADS